jgi:hypothetical protein
MNDYFVNCVKLTMTTLLPRIQFKDLLGHEGLVFVGCGGDLEEWTNGIKLLLPMDCQGIFGEFSLLVSSGGRHDLVLPFLDGTATPMSLVTWRLRFGDCSWISDYIVNYRDHHHHHRRRHYQHSEPIAAKIDDKMDGQEGDVLVEPKKQIDENDEKEQTQAQKAQDQPSIKRAPHTPRPDTPRRPKRRLFVRE